MEDVYAGNKIMKYLIYIMLTVSTVLFCGAKPVKNKAGEELYAVHYNDNNGDPISQTVWAYSYSVVKVNGETVKNKWDQPLHEFTFKERNKCNTTHMYGSVTPLLDSKYCDIKKEVAFIDIFNAIKPHLKDNEQDDAQRALFKIFYSDRKLVNQP